MLASYLGGQINLDDLECVFPCEVEATSLLSEEGDTDLANFAIVYLIRGSTQISPYWLRMILSCFFFCHQFDLFTCKSCDLPPRMISSSVETNSFLCQGEVDVWT